VWIACALSLAGLTACEEDPGSVVIQCADLTTFDDVSNVLEKRCGTLDCHGNLARPFRLYGQGGLRLATAAEVTMPEVAQANGTVSGGKGTTLAEFELNWRSLCALEPERMTQVRRGELQARELLIMRKPLGPEIEGGERHKGGQLYNLGDPAYECLERWIETDNPPVEDCLRATADL
jgi:hypothetical protein